MTNFAILIKSHLPDLPYAERLLASLDRHNVDHVPIFVVVSEDDRPAFQHLEIPGVSLLTELMFSEHLVSSEVAGQSPGYINQEIIKLCFWETGLADNYLCLDSDAEMIRDFHVSDFMFDDLTPFTFLTEDAELHVDPAYFAEHWRIREERLRRIQETIGLDSDRLITVHGHAVFSGTVLQAFVERFLKPRGWDYVDALAISPYEPSWYNFWLQKDQSIPIVPREPIIKTFHNADQYLDYALRGITRESAARGYVGIVLNSNFSRGDGLGSLDDDVPSVVARFVEAPEILKAIAQRATTRILRPSRRPPRG